MTETSGLIRAVELLGDGSSRPLGLHELHRPAEGRAIWAQFDREAPGTRRFLEADPEVPDAVVEALLDEHTRPRCSLIEQGLLLILRAVNLNPGAEPDDMVSVRVWAHGPRVISVRSRRVFAVQDITEELERGEGPRTVAELVVRLPEKVQGRATPLLLDLQERGDDLEDQSFEQDPLGLQGQVSVLQRELISVHRHLTPQRTALQELARLPSPWLDDEQRTRVRETVELLTRYLEEVQTLRDRAVVTRDQLAARLSADLNRRLYLLSLLTAVFLPLSFLTGLLGINVGGIPGSGSGRAFWVVCSLLGVLFAAQWMVLRRNRWL